VLVDADAMAAATHAAKQTLHAPWLTLMAPPSLTMTTVSTPTLSLTMRCFATPTLWPPARHTRRGTAARVVEQVVGAAVVDNDELVDGDVVVDNAVLVNSDVVAAGMRHTARKLLHALCST